MRIDMGRRADTDELVEHVFAAFPHRSFPREIHDAANQLLMSLQVALSQCIELEEKRSWKIWLFPTGGHALEQINDRISTHVQFQLVQPPGQFVRRVSRRHARLVESADGKFELHNQTADRANANPILVNGELREHVLLEDGDQVVLGGAPAFTIRYAK